MTTITRERLLKIQQWRETYGPGSNVVLPAEEAEELARIALASLEAEPMAIVEPSDYVTAAQLVGEEPRSKAVRPLFEGALAIGQKLYTAPPAPVSVPAAMEMDDDFDSAFEHGKAVGWNAYRAAMLQSFGNSEQLNSPVIPDGWVACSERMPGEVLAALQNVARLRRNLNDFCGDKSLIAKCLSEAEGALLNAVNRHSTMLAEPLKEAKNV